MRDTSDMMEDVLSEDTMMDCGSDDGLYDLIDLCTDISHSAPTIKDAAERLLTLLGVEDENDDDDDGALSSSEDEGVELDDISDDDDDDDEETENSRLLGQLAASLAQELKYSQKQISPIATRLGTVQRSVKTNHEVTRNQQQIDDQTHCMEIAQETFHQEVEKSSKLNPTTHDQKIFNPRNFHGSGNFEYNVSLSPEKFRSETRLRRTNHDHRTTINEDPGCSGSWMAGWDACAAEAVRYLIEDEGLSSMHPTVVAMKTHLELQRERVLAQCGV